MFRCIIRWCVLGFGILATSLTALPLIPSNEAWIRMWDFPRVQLTAVLACVVVAAPLLLDLKRAGNFIFAAASVLALAWQGYRIWPYTPLAEPETKIVSGCEPRSTLRLLVANVSMSNRDAGPLLKLVRGVEPDLVLLVETDRWWDEHLQPLRETFSSAISLPQDNTYGMHLFSRFELVNPQVRRLIEDYVPSIKTQLRLRSGARIEFHGLHPKPPPRHDTALRDAELLIVAREVRTEKAAAIIAGDLNDVAWSRTTQLFRNVSGLIDPRIGRAPYSTYNANWGLLRWPLDHVFFEPSFSLMALKVLPDIGSDHFPLFVALCHDPAAKRVHEGGTRSSPHMREAKKAIEEGRKEARE